ncbi:NADP-dependent aldehyde dehydrogenase [Tenacibaculum sp. MAR_2009_124]|uniref:aldehyde dehydrogenase (NADP(+)) n=1 Tax=Tenacibaculum sp. MAR_2009_124 TaxID=1250059 RepID=UPI0008999E85|nr:aldehyde dehydrogenase (NADP(+)) [Tenacibaculum sp. MAR_2009_124]SED15326.1 NADP-dependent aldehyde dehydrogenase [Tenacibaculum sp. MAR_2009_124]
MATTTITKISGQNYIGNKLSATGKTTYKTYNPELQKENSTLFYEASNDEINQALFIANQAFEDYKTFPGKKKSEFLNKIADEILNLGDTLVTTYCSETGLPPGRAIGERTRTIFQLRSFAELVSNGSWVEASIDTGVPDRKPMPKPDLRRMNIPLGPVVVFGASNFPLAYSTAGGDTAAALAAGCPVIVKSHPMHAGTGELVASAIIKAAKETGMPNGIFSNLNSKGIEVGQKLAAHSQVKAIGFTGSIQGGRALFDIASKRDIPIPVFAEMGSINPVVILPDALKTRGEELAKTYANSITLGTGQFCTNPGLILGIESDYFNNFINHLSKEIIKINPTCMLNPSIKKAFSNNQKKVVEEKNVSVKVTYNKEISNENYAPQTLAIVSGENFISNPNLQKEVFGPFSLLVKCADKQELEKAISCLEGQLTGTILGNILEINKYNYLLSLLYSKVGRIIFNGVPTGVEVCPSMVHGGPYPSSTDSRFSAVGTSSIKRWVRPFSFQNWPNELLPEELKNENSLGILRLVNNQLTNQPI